MALNGAELVKILIPATPNNPSAGWVYVTTQDFANLIGSSARKREVLHISADTDAGNDPFTDYVYFCIGTLRINLPDAPGNQNRYSVINLGTGIITLGGSVNGSVDITIPTQNESLEIMSNETDFSII